MLPCFLIGTGTLSKQLVTAEIPDYQKRDMLYRELKRPTQASTLILICFTTGALIVMYVEPAVVPSTLLLPEKNPPHLKDM